MGKQLRLQTIINRYYLFAIMAFSIIAGVLLFFLIKYQLNRELNEELQSERINLEKAIRGIDTVSSTSILINGDIAFKKISGNYSELSVLYDSLMFDEISGEYIPYRLISFRADTRLGAYVVTIRKSQIETSDLVSGIFLSLTAAIIFLGVILFIVNYYFSKRLWKPLLKTINTVKEFKINGSGSELVLGNGKIAEFNDLNNSLEQMSKRIISDFIKMKEFSENASHEIQTPLAVIRSKLETLLQNRDLSEEEVLIINQALESTVRLSRMVQTLLLITKIENRQFTQTRQTSFSKLSEKYIETYSGQASTKNIVINVDIKDDFTADINPELADILVSNLFNNAVRHNIQGGYIHINISEDRFVITNSGDVPEFSVEELFERFRKGGKSGNTGLGLSLVKEISSASRLNIVYEYKEGEHRISITRLV